MNPLRGAAVPAAVALTLLSAAAASAEPRPGTPGPLDTLFASLPHASFEWSAAEGVSDRAAMRVPVDLDGTEGWLQFDTGLDVTLLYGDLPSRRKWEAHDGMVHVPRVKIGEMDLGPAWLRTRPDADTGGGRLGSLGLDLLVGKWVLIDYPGRRLTIMDPGQAPLWLLQRATWTPAELRDAKLFLTVVLAGKTVDGLFFDTGASAFDITVDRDTWTRLTGIGDPDSATTRWTVRSWGAKLTALGAPAGGPLVIGSARIPDPRVFMLKEQPNLFAGWPFPATGLVGNAPFWDRVVILDLGIRPRFGVLE